MRLYFMRPYVTVRAYVHGVSTCTHASSDLRARMHDYMIVDTGTGSGSGLIDVSRGGGHASV